MFEPHSSKQDEAIFSDAPITIAATGIQWGKSQSGSLWLKRYCHTHTEPTDNFIMTAPNYKIMQQSCLPRFLQDMKGCGTYNKVDAEFRIHGGGTVYMRTGTEPDSVVGITNVRAIWGDEAGKYSLYFWENIQGRAAFMAAPVMITTSPYTLNWLYKDFIRPHMKGKLDKDVNLIQASSIENPYFNKSYYNKKKKTMDPMRFNMMFGGQWGRMDGLVYKCWDDDINQMDEKPFPGGTRFFGNIDWGYTHPMHIGLRGITPGGEHWKFSEFHKTGQTITDIIEYCKRVMTIWPIECFFCGPDQPASIEALNRAGIPAVPAKNDVRIGIDKHYELIRTGRFKVFKGKCPYTLDEIDTYHYAEPKDLKADQDDKDRLPVKQTDDAVDSDRYGTIETYDLKNLQPKLPRKFKDPRAEAMKRLLRKPGQGPHTEEW